MSAANVFVTVSDPDQLIAGSSPYAPFVVVTVQLYRWTTEALARVGSAGAGTLVTTFTLIASSAPVTEEAGPFRFATYDSGQGDGSWYRYRFASAGGLSLSIFSEAWQADNRDQLTLRELLYEVGDILGQSVIRGTASAGAANTVTSAAIFQSTLRDQRLYEGWWLLLSQDAGGLGAAPEGEEALVASVVGSTGVATLERSLSAAIANGDLFMLFSYLQPSEMVRCVNRAREEMQVVSTVDVALSSTEYRFPAPTGVRAETDILSVRGVRQFSNSNREDEFPLDFGVEFDGIRGWLTFDGAVNESSLARVRYLRSYRDLEGNLSLMSDTTSAPLEWIRATAAFKCAEFLVDEDPQDQTFGQLKANMEQLASTASGHYAPKVQRKAKRGSRWLPGPVATV